MAVEAIATVSVAPTGQRKRLCRRFVGPSVKTLGYSQMPRTGQREKSEATDERIR